MSDSLLLEISDGVATLTLNRPDTLNSLTTELKEALLATLSDLNDNPEVRALILMGNGRGFCVGQDLAEHAVGLQTGTALDTVNLHYNPIVRLLVGLPFPVVAAINGTAAGAGLGLALHADFRIGTAGARYTTAFSGIGLTTDAGMSWTLQRMVGLTKAQELILLAEPFTSEQALEWGILTKVVALEELATASGELAARLAQGPTFSYKQTRRALSYAAASTLDEALDFEAIVQNEAGATEDHKNAVSAFLSKQKPTFTGH